MTLADEAKTSTPDPPILQDNQKDLETATEVLSEYLERDIGSDLDGEEKEEEEEVDLAEMKRKVQDKTR